MNRQLNAMTEYEELEVACQQIGRKLEDIKIHDDAGWTGFAPADMRFTATFGEPDLDCLMGSGATPQEAMWDLIEFSQEIVK